MSNPNPQGSDELRLLPCPFCGGSNLEYESRNAITCEDCEGQIILSLPLNLSAAEADRIVVAAWNRRSLLPAETGWQPIESAPKFDLLLLAVEGSGERRVFVAQGDQHPSGYRWITCVDASWAPLHGGWTPIAWQPLPAPPPQSLSGEEKPR